MRSRGVSTAALASRSGLDRAALKQKLAGSAELTVDEFIVIAQALEVTPDQLGLAGPASPEPVVQLSTGGPRLAVVGDTGDEPPDEWTPDPVGNLPSQIMRLGFALGVDLYVMFDTVQLTTSGVPVDVLKRFPQQLPIKLDAKYHAHNRPEFGEEDFSCVLSFDRLCTCTFPWSSFRQVNFHIPVEEPAPPEPPPPAPPRTPGLHLRVVK